MDKWDFGDVVVDRSRGGKVEVGGRKAASPTHASSSS
jgi:hypothetical protein